MRPHIVLLCACLLLLAQCLLFSSTRFVEDEGWNSDVSLTWMREGHLRMSSFPTDFTNKLDARPPLLAFAMGESFRLFGTGVLQARLSSILAGIGVVIVGFLLGWEIGGPWVAWITAIFLACDNFLLITARSARPEPHTTLFATLGLLLYYKRRPLLAGLAIGVAVDFHPLGIGFAAAIGLLMLMDANPKRILAYGAGLVIAIAPYAFWLASDDLHRAGFRATYMSRAVESSFLHRVAGEISRLSDFVGLGNQRVPLPFHIPYRLHIAVIVAAALIYLIRKRPGIAVILGVNFFWWVFMVNKSPRYITALTPIFAVAVASALVALGANQRWRTAAVAIGVIFAGTQLAGNAFLLYRYRTADYEAVARQLREVVPPGQSVYGITTFYLAMNDRPYYSYDRTPLDYAVNHLHARYLILYDRVMMHGSGHGEDNFAQLRWQAADFVKDHATLAGRVSNDFYGNLEVYRVNE